MTLHIETTLTRDDTGTRIWVSLHDEVGQLAWDMTDAYDGTDATLVQVVEQAQAAMTHHMSTNPGLAYMNRPFADTLARHVRSYHNDRNARGTRTL